MAAALGKISSRANCAAVEGNLPLLLVQVFRGKDFGGGAGFQQKAAARGGDDGEADGVVMDELASQI
jgi:hypothetical protein